MNRKLSLIILLMLFAMLITVLLTFMAFSKSGEGQDVGELKSGYEQLTKQVKELKVTTEELGTKVENNSAVATAPNTTTAPATTPQQTPPTTAPATTVTPTKTIIGNKINMRSTPSTGARVVKQLANGEKVTPTGKTENVSGYTWIQVKDASGNLGWVVSSYVK